MCAVQVVEYSYLAGSCISLCLLWSGSMLKLICSIGVGRARGRYIFRRLVDSETSVRMNSGGAIKKILIVVHVWGLCLPSAQSDVPGNCYSKCFDKKRLDIYSCYTQTRTFCSLLADGRRAKTTSEMSSWSTSAVPTAAAPQPLSPNIQSPSVPRHSCTLMARFLLAVAIHRPLHAINMMPAMMGGQVWTIFRRRETFRLQVGLAMATG